MIGSPKMPIDDFAVDEVLSKSGISAPATNATAERTYSPILGLLPSTKLMVLLPAKARNARKAARPVDA